MKKNLEIKIAGLGLEWAMPHAISYKNCLIEDGWIAKILEGTPREGVLVAYSVRNFSRREAMAVLSGLLLP